MKRNRLTRLVSKWQPWDYGCNLLIEQELFRKNAIYFAKSNIVIDSKWVSEKCDLLVKLLNIVLEKDPALRIAYKYKDSPILEFHSDKWELSKYINTRNYKRFVNWTPKEWNNFHKDELRQQKAWYLYNKLRYYIMRLIWE